jgi:hypothetical protein
VQKLVVSSFILLLVTLGWGKLMGADDYGHSGHVPTSHAISCMHGIDPDTYERHTALGDARWVRDLYNTITKEN